jgi:hypothetical protein
VTLVALTGNTHRAARRGYSSGKPSNKREVMSMRFLRRFSRRTSILVAFLLTGVAMPAFAAGEPKKGSDADEEFMLGIRKVGVMVGQAFTCTGEEARGAIGEDALQLANQIATHFGLQAAFIFSGSFGYGTGHPFDTTTCPATLANFKTLQQKYLGK